MIAEIEAVVSYQTLTSILVVCMTGVVGWIGKAVVSELRTIVAKIHQGDLERGVIGGKVRNLETKIDAVDEKIAIKMQAMDEKIDLKGEMRRLETIVLRTAPLPIKDLST